MIQIKVRLKRSLSLYSMLLPVAVIFLIFQMMPIFYSVLVGFKDYDLARGLLQSDWVGFKYFVQFFKDPFFFRLLRNTFLLGFTNLLWRFWPPILLAILLNEVKTKGFKKVVQSVTYLPYFISTVVVVSLLFSIFSYDGVVNKILQSVGKESVVFISNPKYFRTLYNLAAVWQKTGYYAIIYIAAISNIDPQLYEAATIDSANRFQQMWHITFKGILPTVIVLTIIDIGHILIVAFERVLIMYSPSVYETADVIQTYVYRRGILDLDYGYAGALDLFNMVLSLILVVGANRLVKKFTEESLW